MRAGSSRISPERQDLAARAGGAAGDLGQPFQEIFRWFYVALFDQARVAPDAGADANSRRIAHHFVSVYGSADRRVPRRVGDQAADLPIAVAFKRWTWRECAREHDRSKRANLVSAAQSARVARRSVSWLFRGHTAPAAIAASSSGNGSVRTSSTT